MTNDGVSNLVIRHHLLFIVLKHAALLFKTSHNSLDRFTKVLLFNTLALGSSRQKCRFIDQVGQVGTSETAGGLGDAVEVNLLGKFHFLGVNLKNGFATGEVRTVHQNLAVKTTRTQQGSIKNFRLVCGRQHDHWLVLSGETIHLGEQLVQGLLPLVIATHDSHRA